MVPCSASQPDAGAIEWDGGCLWADGDDTVDADSDCAFVWSSYAHSRQDTEEGLKI